MVTNFQAGTEFQDFSSETPVQSEKEALVRVSLVKGSAQPRQGSRTAAGGVVCNSSGYILHAYVLIGMSKHFL
jgi:hypothetical protein